MSKTLETKSLIWEFDSPLNHGALFGTIHLLLSPMYLITEPLYVFQCILMHFAYLQYVRGSILFICWSIYFWNLCKKFRIHLHACKSITDQSSYLLSIHLSINLSIYLSLSIYIYTIYIYTPHTWYAFLLYTPQDSCPDCSIEMSTTVT